MGLVLKNSWLRKGTGWVEKDTMRYYLIIIPLLFSIPSFVYGINLFPDGCGVPKTSTEGLIKIYGKNYKLEQRPIKNKYTDFQDSIDEYRWRDFKASYYVAKEYNKYILSVVEVFNPKIKTRKDILSKFGKFDPKRNPDPKKMIRFFYETETGEEDVTVYFKGDTVERIVCSADLD